MLPVVFFEQPRCLVSLTIPLRRLSIAAALFCAAVSSAWAQTPTAAPAPTRPAAMARVAYVDSKIIIDKYSRAQSVLNSLNAAKTAAQTELKGKSDALEAQVRTYQQGAATMTPQARQQREQQLVGQQQALQQLATQKQQALAQRLEREMQPIYAQVRQVIGKVGKAEGYTFVFDNPTDSPVNVVLYADPSIDLTFRVLEELRKTPAPAAARPATRTPARRPTTPRR